jgi:hypothetical protein
MWRASFVGAKIYSNRCLKSDKLRRSGIFERAVMASDSEPHRQVCRLIAARID